MFAAAHLRSFFSAFATAAVLFSASCAWDTSSPQQAGTLSDDSAENPVDQESAGMDYLDEEELAALHAEDVDDPGDGPLELRAAWCEMNPNRCSDGIPDSNSDYCTAHAADPMCDPGC